MANMSTAYTNNLFQSPAPVPDPDGFGVVYEARYNPAYSSQPSSPSERFRSSVGVRDIPRTDATRSAYCLISRCSLHEFFCPRVRIHRCRLRKLDCTADGAGQNPDEQAFAATLQSYMVDSDIETALQGFSDCCLQHSRLLREEGMHNQHRAARLMHLQAEASALEAEAATWRLLLHTYARMQRMYPAGSGGLQTSIPTVHHAVASIISDKPELLQCARVVTWLEELASDSLAYSAEQNLGPRFHQNSGMWLDTQAALQDNGSASGLISQLDPDATTRQKASLAPNSGRDEDTLNSYLFELVKAGQISEAAKTCMECGQPWRAASLLGGGPYGPEPLGPAAEQQASEILLEHLSAGIEANSNVALRSIWKWTCYQVAEAAESRGNSPQAAGQHEAAVYAALAGHSQKILPVCQTRADVLWAYARSWLALQVDQQLSVDQGQDSNLQSALQLGQDNVKAVQRADPEEVRKVVLDDVTSFWPPKRLTEALPDTFAEVLDAASEAAAALPSVNMAQWQLHQDIIQERFAPLLARFATDDVKFQAAKLNEQPEATTSRQQAAELRLGAHLALALCYLPVGLPQPQDQLHVRSGEAAEEEPDPEALGLSTAEDLALQDTVNQLLQQYTVHLIRTEQHQLIPLYACHMRRDVRRATYAAYLQRLTERSMDECWSVYQDAQQHFMQFPRGDIQGNTELADIAEQVMGQAFWNIQDGPRQWAATLRWLCFSDHTLPLAVREANRVLRQLSLGGHPALNAAFTKAFEALAQSDMLQAMLTDESQLPEIVSTLSRASNDVQTPRDCAELYVWYQFYHLDSLYASFHAILAEMGPEDNSSTEELLDYGQQYINGALELCSGNALSQIWERQDAAFQQPHTIKMWVTPAVDENSPADAQDGKSYNVLAGKEQLADFVQAVQDSVQSCCVEGVQAEVTAVTDPAAVALITVQSDHSQVDIGTEVQCLSAALQAKQLLQVVRTEGPDLCIGALTSMAAYPHLLLQAAELRQVLIELFPQYGFAGLGEQVIPLVAGTESGKNVGLTYYFSQKQLQQILQYERQTQIRLMADLSSSTNV